MDITDTLVSKPNDPNPMRLPTDITHISVHHSAVEGSTIESYARYHVLTKGWFHIGYHMVIKGDQAFQTNDILTFSYHTASNNAHSVSVSISGDLSKRTLSEIERNILYGVILTYMSIFNIPIDNVLGHNEFPGQATSCPSIDMQKVRSDIATLQMTLKQQETWEAKLNKVSQIGNQINYMNNLIKVGKDDNNARWAVDQQMKLYEIMKAQKLLP